MKKYKPLIITWIILLLCLLTFVFLIAPSTKASDSIGMVQYQELDLRFSSGVVKIYDHDEDVLCYVYEGYKSGGISCIKE